MSLGALTALARNHRRKLAVDRRSLRTCHAGRDQHWRTDGTRSPSRSTPLRRGGLLHDIGKIGVPVDVLNKPGKLTADEFETVKDHVTVGLRILEPIEAYSDLLPIVRSHHERIRRPRLPRRVGGRRHPATGSDRCRGRHVRRADVGPSRTERGTSQCAPPSK